MLTQKRFFLVLFILMNILAFNTNPTSASQCAPPGSPAEEFERATAVFAGRAIDVEDPNAGSEIASTADPIIYTFQVLTVLKGPNLPTLKVTTARSGINGGIGFEIGQEYLVYAYGSESSLGVSWCSRTKLLSEAKEELRFLSPPHTIGDFNGDGQADFIVADQWGITILTFDGLTLTTLMAAPNGTRFGGWLYDSNANQITGVGDFNNDGREDFIIHSGWGIGILTFDGSTLTTLMAAPNGTRFGGWLYDSNANQVMGVGDFNKDGRDDFIIHSGWGIGILTFDGSTLTTLMAAPNGTRFGGWLYDSNANQITGVGDFNNDGRDEFIVHSGWGIGILTFDGSSLTTLMAAPNGTRFGGWLYDSNANQIMGVGDFNKDEQDDFIIQSGWGIGILTFDGSTLTTLMAAPNGTRFGGWLYDSNANQITGVGDFNNDRQDDFIVYSGWGIGILTFDGLTLTTLMAAPNGTRFGG